MRHTLIAALIIALSITGCGGSSSEVPVVIEIGAAMPLTGKYAAGGAEIQRGYTLAVEKINADGGVFVKAYNRKLPLNLNILDDSSDPGKTVSHLETHFSDTEVVAYLGGFGSDLHAAAAAIAEKNQVPYIGVAFALWGIHQQGYKYLFSPFFKSPDLGKHVYEFLNEVLDGRTRYVTLGTVPPKVFEGGELVETTESFEYDEK